MTGASPCTKLGHVARSAGPAKVFYAVIFARYANKKLPCSRIECYDPYCVISSAGESFRRVFGGLALAD